MSTAAKIAPSLILLGSRQTMLGVRATVALYRRDEEIFRDEVRLWQWKSREAFIKHCLAVLNGNLPRQAKKNSSKEPFSIPLTKEVEELVKQRIQHALKVSGGTQKEAASRLGLTYRQFRHLLYKHRLLPQQLAEEKLAVDNEVTTVSTPYGLTQFNIDEEHFGKWIDTWLQTQDRELAK